MTFPFFGAFDPDNLPPDMPEEMKSEIRRVTDAARSVNDEAAVRAEVAQNEVFQFFAGLHPEQMGTLSRLLGLAATAEHSELLLGQWLGQIDGIMRLQYPNLCRHCGKERCSNSAPLPELPAQADEATRARAEAAGLVIPDAGDEFPPSPERIAALEEEARVAREAAMQEYNVVVVGGSFKCGGCGSDISSLEDRMLRPPGVKGCQGCQQQAKFG